MNSTIKVFKAEKEAGLTEKLRATSSVAYVSKLEPLDPANPLAIKVAKASATPDHPSETLYPMRDILVTAGWNLNRDIFEGAEMWVARYSPVHHPLNFEHDEKRIIGNITTSQAVDSEYNPLPEDLAVDELPATYHILNGSVIYRVWEDEAQQALIDRTIAEIEKGEWFVSMECKFKGFDYGVVRPDGTMGIVPRDESSAFLTKHLRQYGGNGTWRSEAGLEFQLGRVLRNISFIGKGLVRQPANPSSVILNNVSSFASTFASLEYIQEEAEVPSTDEHRPEITDMPEENVELQRLQERVNQLVTANTELKNQLDAKTGESAKAEIDRLNTEVSQANTKVASLESTINELNATVAALVTRAETAESGKTAVESELNTLKAEKVEMARIAVLTGKGAAHDKAVELVKQFSQMNDEQFTKFADTISVAWVQPTPTQPKKPEDVINNATASTNVNLGSVSDSTEEEKSAARVAKASKLIGGFLKINKNVPAAGQAQE